jgi:hypothetical protein
MIRCEEKAALMMAYQTAVTVYSQAVADLSRAVDGALYGEWDLLQRNRAAARQLSEDARNRLEQHQLQHSC